MIQATGVSRVFSTPGGKVTALDQVSLSVPDGSFAAVIGKSGSGKSTLLSLLGALDSPSDGSIKVGDKEVTKLSMAELTKFRRELIGFVFQSFQLIPNLSALQNVMLPMEFAGVPAKERRERAGSLLEQVGLPADKQSRLPSRLSGGEQQRVAIARALANKPSVILADEPTGNLDSTTGRVVVDLLHKLAKTEKVTIVAVTHDLGLAKEADMTFHLQDGKLTRKAVKEIGKSVQE